MWEQTLREYHAHIKAVKCAATADSYRAGAKHFVLFLEERGLETLEGTSEALLDEFVVWVIEQGMAPVTLKSRLVGVDTYLEYLRRRGHNVPKYGRPSMPKIWAKEPRVLSMDELGLYMALANEAPEPTRTILLLFPLCGLRSDEITRLRLDSISSAEGWVLFRFHGKGRKPREVPLLRQGNALLREYLSGWRAKQDQENPWLFPGHFRGTHLTTRTIRKWVEWISSEIGIPELSPHTLRATYSTMLDAMGVSPFKIAQMMGHSNMRTTKQSYVHHSFNSLVEGLAKIVVPNATPKVA